MKVTDIRKIWKSMGQKKVKGFNTRTMKKQELIRHIQKTEGNAPCYKGNFSASCGQTDCLWFEDCKK